jgi:hypothetical protein
VDSDCVTGPQAGRAADAASLPAAERLDEIPGLGREAAAALIAEIGLDMSRFASPQALVSWAGLTPTARQSGPRKGRGTKGHGNTYAKRIAVTDLDHPRLIGGTVISGPANGHLLPLIPDDASDPCRAAGVLLDLPAAHPPRSPPLRSDEVPREGHRTHSVRRRQVTGGQSPERRRRQMHDAHVPRGMPVSCTRRLRWNHRASLPHGLTRWNSRSTSAQDSSPGLP